jgi:hypothetical protein
MKTRLLISLFVGIGIIVTVPILYGYSQLHQYSLEIEGMKDTYFIGEEYSFYYTLSGLGNTCGSWLVWFPDQSGDIIHRGEVVDCHRPTSTQFDYDSRTDARKFSSLVPKTEGTYNVTVSVEKVKEPAIYEFKVISPDK